MKPTLSLKFQIFMGALSALFWLIGLIPVVNLVSSTIYDIIVVIIFIYKYKPIFTHIMKSGVSIGSIYLKIGLIEGISAILNLIPFVCWLPWTIISTLWINQLTKQMLAKIDDISKDAESLKKGKRDLPGKMEIKATGDGKSVGEDQASRFQEIAQNEPPQYAEDGEAGRISSPKPKIPQPNFNYNNSDPQKAGRFVTNGGIIK